MYIHIMSSFQQAPIAHKLTVVQHRNNVESLHGLQSNGDHRRPQVMTWLNVEVHGRARVKRIEEE